MGERMFEVTRYEPPEIFVTSRRTGETYKFSVGGDGAVIDELLPTKGMLVEQRSYIWLIEREPTRC